MSLFEGTYLKAVAEIDYAGLRLRGLKLEHREGRFTVALPGRRMRGGWQVVYEIMSDTLQERLRSSLVEEYFRRRAA
jgi:hypothetical protein